MARLIIVSGPDRGTEHELGQSQTIGRLKRNEIHLDDDGTSRQHARITRHGEAWRVVDLDSKNGITLNGERVKRADLNDGDELLVGNTMFRFTSEAPATEEAAERTGGRTVRGGAAAAVAMDSEISFGKGQRTATSATRIVTSTHKTHTTKTRTSLLWLLGDFEQVGGSYKLLLTLGVIVVVLGLGYLAFVIAAG